MANSKQQHFRIPAGFTGAAMAAGLKPSGKTDLGLIVSRTPCTAAGLFTRNTFAGGNIGLCREHLKRRTLRGIVVHAGQANACTGREGEAVALATAVAASEATGHVPGDFIVGSTGVIGVLPDVRKLRTGINTLVVSGLTESGVLDVGRAMMTTDLVPKTAGATLKIGGKNVTILGMTKGSGMIHPAMGTMLAYILTDIKIAKPALKAALRDAVDESFHCLTVDGDTSTSDMVVALANGEAGNKALSAKDLAAFRKALTDVCQSLARAIARDGEGATRLVTVAVKRAATKADARRVGMAIASSSLVKCAIFGRDPNWGRIAAAVGYSGASFDPARVAIRMGGALIFSAGKPAPQDKKQLARYLRESDEVVIEVTLAAGRADAVVWSCDLSTDYVRINSEYTT